MDKLVYPKFSISDEARALGIKGAFVIMDELNNSWFNPNFEVFKNEYIRDLASRTEPRTLEHDPILSGFAEMHKKIGKTGRSFLVSSQSLLVSAIQKRSLPQINLLVDIYNLISIKTKLSFGMHDIDKVAGNIRLDVVNKETMFTPIGADKPVLISVGEYAYIDDAGDILCRMEVRQCEKTKVSLTTTRGFYVIQGNQNTSDRQIKAAVEELISLTTAFCGGRVIRVYYEY